MATTITPLPQVSRAASKYLEQQSALLVTINLLKGLLCLAFLVIAVLGWSSWKMSKLVINREPIVVRVNSVGFAEAVALKDQHFVLQPEETQFFLKHFVEDYYGRSHARVQRDYTDSLYFLSTDLYNKVADQDRKTKWMSAFLGSQNAEETEVEVTSVEIESLDKAPYRGRVEFTKRMSTPGQSGQEPRIERWTANIQFAKAATITNDMVPHNPLGLIVKDLQITQEFEGVK